MLPRLNGGVWMDDREDRETVSWTRTSAAAIAGTTENKDEMGCLSTFKSMLEVEDDWYMAANNNIQGHSDVRDISFSPSFADPESLLLNPVDSSSSCSPSSSVFNNLDPNQVHYYMPQNPNLSSLLNVVPNNPLDHGFDLGCDIGFLDTQASTGGSSLMNRGGGVLTGFNDLSSNSQMNAQNLGSNLQFSTTRMPQLLENSSNFSGFQGLDDGSANALFPNRPKLLRPLESFPSVGAQPTLFQKRAALRKNLADGGRKLGVLGSQGGLVLNEGNERKREMGVENEKKRKMSGGDDVDDLSFDGSGLNYDSDEFTENTKVDEGAKNGGNSSNAKSSVTAAGGGGGGGRKGKKKGLPAKNLMAERRRRQKLNDRLYMLRSVVPKISKMDRASILGDAIEYLKELLQRINNLHNELESIPPGSALTPTGNTFHPLTPTPATLPNRIKEELCPSSLPSPNGQPARVEVRQREGRAVNIHMFCGRRPGLLLSTMRTLDNLGLDIQQAVISCFNGFAMDVFRAEQCMEGQDVHPDQIKAVLLDLIGFHGMV
ncbi:hypothetical protein C1H46_031784 [Malus baccata]|uniref:BHLH domain-containing protein n=1 Tax=Malus baccata TaxID=106549 RepID=A0A540L890_MALBA|nr:hypothetical protein C1H46_031784 [Malus baccata]